MVRDLREIGKKIIFSLLNKHVIITLLFIQLQQQQQQKSINKC